MTINMLTRSLTRIIMPAAQIDPAQIENINLTESTRDAMRAAGWTDEALYFAITVCALFNFYNRWIDASGVHAMSDEAHRQGAKRSAVHGYVRT